MFVAERLLQDQLTDVAVFSVPRKTLRILVHFVLHPFSHLPDLLVSLLRALILLRVSLTGFF